MVYGNRWHLYTFANMCNAKSYIDYIRISVYISVVICIAAAYGDIQEIWANARETRQSLMHHKPIRILYMVNVSESETTVIRQTIY